ncbi:MAG: pantoate--beta-alanine ligase [Alkaliphilus sp.]|nr:pantoate--beta-alanine ligase [Alkaliphilus sp.]
MLLINSIYMMNIATMEAKNEGKSIGFVPTMGYLHKGHISLIEKARSENDLVVVSIFVNPTQFGPKEDYEQYPRNLNRDMGMAKSVGADIIFCPEVSDMYPQNFKTTIHIKGISEKLCGSSRPKHFDGVATVVNKFFNIVKPTRAYFGRKDAQQVAIIEQMVKDLHMDVDIIPCPIIRDEDGLALSSRNVLLNKDERIAALVLNRSLNHAKALMKEKEINIVKIKKEILEMIAQEPLAIVDYVEILDSKSLNEIKELRGSILIALAVKIGETRLIDNIVLEE